METLSRLSMFSALEHKQTLLYDPEFITSYLRNLSTLETGHDRLLPYRFQLIIYL
jgi:hypothetical protein